MIVKEGSVSIKVPKADVPEHAPVFYNPVMGFDRNISVCFCDLIKPEITLDALSATGVRALRYRKESGLDVCANDCNPKSVRLIRGNVRRNKAQVRVTEKDANLLMRQEHFDAIDVDPFGSPIGFIDSACASIGGKGFLAFTATDTAPLCGTYPQVAERRYGIRSMKTDYYSELGLRILLTAVMKIFARQERVFVPLFSYSRLHYFRAYGRVEKGVKAVEKQLKEMGWISHCFKCGWRKIEMEKTCPECGAPAQACRVYIGQFKDKDFLGKLEKKLQESMFVPEEKLVQTVGAELEEPFYYDLHYLYKKLKKESKSMEQTMDKIKESGFRVSRTHFCPTAVKTDTNFKDIKKLI